MKKERGAITIITLVTVLFITAFLASTFFIIENRRQSQIATKRETVGIYEGEIDNLADIYDGLIAKNENVNFQTRLPSIYQEVEYIESSGTQYINTGYVIPADNTKELYFETVSMNLSATASDNCVAGAQNGTGEGKQIKLPNYCGNNVEINFYNKNNSAFTRVNNEKVTFTCSGKSGKQYFEYNGEKKETTSTGTVSITRPIYLFANNGDYVAWYFTGRIYYALFKENGVPVREFIPCYRKVDGTIGMYDLVEGQFYTNAGTGTFIKGLSIEDSNECSSYEITYSLTNVTKTSGATAISANGTETIVIAANSGYALPDNVEISGATLQSYTKSTGTIVIENPTGEVMVTVVGEEEEIEDLVAGLVPGLYDENDNLLVNWKESGIDVSENYRSGDEDSTPTTGDYVITNRYPTARKFVLPKGTTTIGNFSMPHDQILVVLPGTVTYLGVYSVTCSEVIYDGTMSM